MKKPNLPDPSRLLANAADTPKQAVSIRFDSDVLDYFKAQGKGCQAATNNALREYTATH